MHVPRINYLFKVKPILEAFKNHILEYELRPAGKKKLVTSLQGH